MGYERPNDAPGDIQQDSRPPGRGDVITELRDFLARKNIDQKFSLEFLDKICMPERPYEKPHRTACIGRGYRWDYGYRNRIMQSIGDYVKFDAKTRKILNGGVEDGVRWAGEPIEQYIEVCNETAVMSEVGADEYRRQVFAGMRKLGAKMAVEEKGKEEPKYAPADEEAFRRGHKYEERKARGFMTEDKRPIYD